MSTLKIGKWRADSRTPTGTPGNLIPWVLARGAPDPGNVGWAGLQQGCQVLHVLLGSLTPSLEYFTLLGGVTWWREGFP